MAERRRLTLEDMEGAGSAALEGSTTAAKRRRVTLRDMGMEEDQNKPEEPFSEGSTLQATVPLPGDWGTYDSGIPIGKRTAQFLAGAGKRFVDVRRRQRQLTGDPTAQREIDEARDQDRPLMSTTPGILGRMAPDVLATLPLSGPLSVAGRTLNLSGPAAAMGIGATQGFSEPVPTGESGTLNTIAGAVAGPLGWGVGRVASTVGGKLANLTPGLIPDGVRAAAQRRGVYLPRVQWEDDGARRLYDLAAERNVPVSIGDLDPTSMWRRTENVLADMPSGRHAHMLDQREGMRSAVERTRDAISAGHRGNEGAEIANGLQGRYNDMRTEASRRFRVVDDIARNDPNVGPIRPVGTFQAAQEAAAEYPDLFQEFQNAPHVRKILGLERDTAPQPGLIIDPNTNAPFHYDQELTFDEAQALRKRLGAWYGKLQTQAERGTLPQGLDGNAVRQAARIFSAFDNDLERWGMQPNNEPLNLAWTDARDFFRENVIPYRDPKVLDSKSKLIRDVVNDNVDVETLPAKVLPTRETSIASDVMDLSTPRGQQAVKSALINRMVEDATSPDVNGLDTAALLRHTNRYSHNGENVFTPFEQQEIGGVRDLARATSRSGTMNPDDNKGRLMSMVMGGTAMLGLPAAGLYATRAFDEQMSPGERAMYAIGVLPMVAALGSRGLNGYTTSRLGQNIHFVNPELEGIMGGLQRYGALALRNAAEPLEDEVRTGELGHRR